MATSSVILSGPGALCGCRFAMAVFIVVRLIQFSVSSVGALGWVGWVDGGDVVVESVTYS